MSDCVRVRFAPSPTGYLHVGGARTALFNWLFARRQGGSFVLRMEDTDTKRNTAEARQTIFEGLRWLGLDPDEGPEQGGPHGPYSQSERGAIYAEAVEELKQGGALYPCFCTRERLQELRATQEQQKLPYGYDRRCRGIDPDEARRRIEQGEAATWRLAVPEGQTVLEDLVRGTITVDHADVEDIILIRADGTPVYNLAVVIDDHHMRITHVLRGEDHLTNTFKQVILFSALRWEPPVYAHLPLILGPTGEGKLSKRKHPEAALEHYMAKGYPPEAMVNWLARIGWSLDDKTEIIPRDDLVRCFDLERVQAGGARLPLDKLESLGGHYLRALPRAEVARKIGAHLQRAGLIDGPEGNEDRLDRLAVLFHERLTCFSQIVEQARWAFEAPVDYEPKAAKNLLKQGDVAELLLAYADDLPEALPAADALEEHARAFVASRDLGFGRLVHPVRAALTGTSQGPPLFDCLALLGRDEARDRMQAAARWIGAQAGAS